MHLDGFTFERSAGTWRGNNLILNSTNVTLVNAIIEAALPENANYGQPAFVALVDGSYDTIRIENNHFNGPVDRSSRPNVLQIWGARSVEIKENDFNSLGGGSAILLAEHTFDRPFESVLIQDNFIDGGGKGIATYNGEFSGLKIIDNTIINTERDGLNLNEGSVILSGLVQGNIIHGSGSESLAYANLSVTSLGSNAAVVSDAFTISGNDFSYPHSPGQEALGITLIEPNNDVTREQETGVFAIALSNSSAAPALPLARTSDADTLAVTRFADGLGYVNSLTPLEDGSVLVTTTDGSNAFDPANRSRLIRLKDTDGDGVAEIREELAELEGLATSVERLGSMVFTTSTAQAPPSINIWRTGSATGNDSQDPLELAGRLQFTFPPGFLHTTYALAARYSREDPNLIELAFGVGSQLDAPATDPSLTVTLAAGDASTSFAGAELPPDSIQMVRIRDVGNGIDVGAPITIATGVRNPAGMVFTADGDLIFQDNGIDGAGEGGVGTKSADELNIIHADELGLTAPDFGYSEAYTEYELTNGQPVQVGNDPAYREPLVAFTRQLDGSKNEGAVEIAEAPIGFAGEYLNSMFTVFFGGYGASNDENPAVVSDLTTGESFHWIDPNVLWNPMGLLSAPNTLYLADSYLSGGPQPAGVVYRFTPNDLSSFTGLPQVDALSSSGATVTWQGSTDAITELQLKGGSVEGRIATTTSPRALRVAPTPIDAQDPATPFEAAITLDGLDAFSTYAYTVRLGDQVREGEFRTSAGATPPVGLTTQLGSTGDEIGYALLGLADGTLILGGDSTGAWTEPSGAPLHINQGETDAFVTALDASGNPLWTHWLGTNGFDVVRGLAEGPAGSIYVSGNQGRSGDGFLQRLDISNLDVNDQPTLLWQETFTEGYNLARSVVSDPADGSAVVVGYTSASTFESQSSNGSIDAFISKLDADGNKLWTRLAGGSGEDFGMQVAAAEDGLSYYMVGYTDVGGHFDVLFNEYTLDGTLIDSRIFGTSGDDFGEAVAVGSDGVVIAFSTDGNPFGLTNQGLRDAALVKFDPDGNFLWSQIHGSAGVEEARDLTIASDGSILLTGHTGPGSSQRGDRSGGHGQLRRGRPFRHPVFRQWSEAVEPC